MTRLPTFDLSHLKAICDVLGDTHGGFTNSEIDDFLLQTGNGEFLSEGRRNGIGNETKRKRLYRVLQSRQGRDQCGNNVAAFVKASMAPVRFTANQERFHELREQLNRVLAFAGYELSEDGELCVVPVARSVTEAVERAGRLRAELERRRVHPDVLKFCRAELVDENYFHAVLEATKSVADKVRRKTGLSTDGASLVDQALGFAEGESPLLAFNSLQTPTEHSEHRGLMNLMKGLFGAFRNVTAHAPKVHWPMSEHDALDLLTLASLIHRRLDEAVSTSPGQS